MRLKQAYPPEAEWRKVDEDENETIALRMDRCLGTSIYPNGDYSVTCQDRAVLKNPLLVPLLIELLHEVRHPRHLEWLVRCLPIDQAIDASFLELLLDKVEYSPVMNGWGDSVSRSKWRGVEGLLRKVLNDPELTRDKLFFILAAPGQLPKEEARKHVLDFIPIGPGVAAEAIRKIAEPEDLPVFEALLEEKLDSWDRGRVETTVRQLKKKFA